MIGEPRTHRFVTIEQVVRRDQPETADLDTLFREWGLTNGTTEALWVVAYDNMQGLKTITEVARGGFHDVIVYPAVVLGAVLLAQTDRFLVAHNHTSGPVSPTEEDMHLTEVILDAANVAGLSFEDHIICGPEGRFSFKDIGLLKPAEGLGLKAAIRSTRRKAR